MAAVLFILGAVMVDAVRGGGDSNAETGPTTTTADEEGAETPGLPDAYVVTRHRNQAIVMGDGVERELMRLDLEPGRYEVTGKIGLASRDPQLPFTVDCFLVPSRADGTTPESVGEYGSDYGTLELGPAGGTGDAGAIVLFASQVLDVPGSVRFSCRGLGTDAGVFTHYGTIRAIEVGSIDHAEVP